MTSNYDFRMYYPIDLMWEATRRNLKYKKDYDDYMYEVKNYDDNIFFHSTKWNMPFRLFNPDIDIDLIREEIVDGAKLVSAHPYGHLHSKLYSVEMHRLPEDDDYANLDGFDEVSNDFVIHRFPRKSGNSEYYCIAKNIFCSRLVFSLNPLAPLSAIKRQIEYFVKEEKRRLHNDENGEVLRVNKISKYIEYLQRYDDYVVKWHKWARKKGTEVPCDGVMFNCPEGYESHLLMPPSMRGDKKARNTSKHEFDRSYKYASKLIRHTPNLLFFPAKT